MWPIRLLVALSVVVAAGLAALHLTLRREAELVESLAVLTVLFSAVGLVAVALVKRRERRVITQLAERLAEFRTTVCPSPLAEQFEIALPSADEWEPLLAEVEELSAAYRKASTAFQAVTERVRAEQELRRQSLRWEQTNQKLRETNAGLERLKESYRDLYHKAPVLYFSLDPKGCFAACNDTMLSVLGYQREYLLGKPYTRLLTSEGTRHFLREPAVYARTGEIEARWVKKDGSVIDVWIRTAPTVDEHGRFVRSRSAAQDVTERNRLANELRARASELRQANERLQRINQELDEFTYVVSHDLKEPLRTMEAFSTFLKEDFSATLGPAGADHINHLVEASRRLGRLIDDLLSLSHAGRVINAPRAFDLGEVVATVLADLSDLIQRRHAEVAIEGPLPEVVGDRERIAQLLANLIGNGLKYNRSERPNVLVGVLPSAALNGQGNATAAQVTLFVRDNGIGIAPEYHAQIFRVFRRLHSRDQYEGTGAGLAICKKIVEAHGGRIWVESSPGAGATFYVTLQTPGP